jgi:hypothetical protein
MLGIILKKKEKEKGRERRDKRNGKEGGGGGVVIKARPFSSYVFLFCSPISQSLKFVPSSRFFPSLLHIPRHTRPHWVSNP